MSNAKYIQYRDLTGMDELYDLDTDPYEEHNLLSGNPAAPPALLETMREELQRLKQAAVPKPDVPR